jgi:hypothetical protein
MVFAAQLTGSRAKIAELTGGGCAPKHCCLRCVCSSLIFLVLLLLLPLPPLLPLLLLDYATSRVTQRHACCRYS